MAQRVAPGGTLGSRTLNILYITQDVPALDAGSLRHYHLVQKLAQNHSVTLLSLVFRGDLAADRMAALKPFVKKASLIPVAQHKREPGTLPALRRKISVKLHERASVHALREAVNDSIGSGDIDVVFLTSKLALTSVADVRAVPVVVDCCDAASIRATEGMKLARGGRRARLAVKWLRRRRVERQVAAFAPDVCFASTRDRRVVMGHAPGGEIITNGIDLDYWTRVSPLPTHDSVLFFGALDYEPNHDAALRLVTRIFPLIRKQSPNATLEVVGRDPRPELRRAAENSDGVTITGRVADLRPYLERAAVACIPLRIASGIQNKVLEALAMEVPVVTTPSAAGGLNLPDGGLPPVLSHTSDRDLADAVVKLLSDAALRARIGEEGRAFVARNFDWSASGNLVERMLLRAVERQKASTAQPQTRDVLVMER